MPQLRLIGFRYHPAVGGAEHLARQLLHEIGPRMSADVITLVTDNRSDWLRLLVDGARDREETYEVDGRQVQALGRWPASVRQRLRPLVAFYHLPFSPAPSLMARVLRPQVDALARDADLLHNVFMGREAFSLAFLLAALRHGKPFVFTPLRHQRPLGWNSPAFQELYRRASAVIALSQAEGDWLVRQGVPESRLSIIGAGPLSDESATPELARTQVGDGPFVLFLGQLHDYKGVRALLDAATRLRDRDLRFVFAGPDVRGHASALRGAGANVLYLGTVDERLRDSLLKACLALCVPSSRESFGLVLVEAWNAGRPVIGGPAAATRELIDDGIDGWSVAQSGAEIADRLQRLLNDPGLADSMGRQGKAKVTQRFAWPAVARAHLDLYDRLLRGRQAA